MVTTAPLSSQRCSASSVATNKNRPAVPTFFTGAGSVNTRTRTFPPDTGGTGGAAGSGGGHPVAPTLATPSSSTSQSDRFTTRRRYTLTAWHGNDAAAASALPT